MLFCDKKSFNAFDWSIKGLDCANSCSRAVFCVLTSLKRSYGIASSCFWSNLVSDSSVFSVTCSSVSVVDSSTSSDSVDFSPSSVVSLTTSVSGDELCSVLTSEDSDELPSVLTSGDKSRNHFLNIN